MPVSDEDKRLFLEALGEIQPSTKPGPGKKPASEDFAKMLEEDVGAHPDFVLKHRLDNETRGKQAKPRGDGIAATLDLHASTLEMALRRTEEFLLRCHLKRFRKVLIIHGKGSGILKEGVRRYLEHHPHVAQLVNAGKHQGGEGAVIAILR